MKKQNRQKNKGFVILFAVTLSSIILAISLGVADIALKEVRFGTSAKDTNDAFFAADTGIEQALFYDKTPSTACVTSPGYAQSCDILMTGLGNTGAGCALVTVTKDNTNPVVTTTRIVSKGYNFGDDSCLSTSANRIERELKINY